MPDEPNVGRAPVGRPPKGRARVGRAVGKAQLPEHAKTEMFEVGEHAPPPVFVDPTGGRRRLLRRTAYGIGVLLILALVAIWVSQLLEPARPPARTPCPSSAPAQACRR
ncbi:MAG TPA: hypothetical protein VFG35_30930 [Actinoplanes sp.]|nr:hypothetical protein [Actinoplanes sp.]